MKLDIAEVSPGRIRIAIEGEPERARHAAFVREAAAIPGVRAAYTRWSRNAVTLVVDPNASQKQLVSRVEALISAHGAKPADALPPSSEPLSDVLERRAREIEARIESLRNELREVTRKRDRLRAAVGVYERALAAERRAAGQGES